MDHMDLIIKNKNKLLNAGVILLFVFIAFQIYRFENKEESRLVQSKESELKKNKVVENIALLEKQINAYKKVLVRQDLGSVMNSISNIAKSNSVEIISIKPLKDESYDDYASSSFVITARAADYHSLAEFISKIENYKDIYLVEEVVITASNSGRAEGSGALDLNVSLKISTISYL